MTARTVTLLLNQQQLELMDRAIAQGAASDRQAMVRRALRERELPAPARPVPEPPDASGLDGRRELLMEVVIEPGTGKALEVRQGQLLRIEQIAGAQCVDFNCFNLHDYKEFMHTGRTRTVHGLLPSTGDFLWSAPPRERAMMYLLEDTARCNDVLSRAAAPTSMSPAMACRCTPTATISRPKPSASTASHRTMCTTPSTCS